MLYAGTNLILGVPVDVTAGFQAAQVCEIWSPSRGRRVGGYLMVSSIESLGTVGVEGIIYVTFSDLPYGLNGNDYIAEGDALRLAGDPTVQSLISGPFQNFTTNTGASVLGRSFVEPLYESSRHDLYMVESNGSVRSAFPFNSDCLLGTVYSPILFDYTGLVVVARTQAPRGHWNGLGSRLGVLLTRQHLFVCRHYPLEGDLIHGFDELQSYTRIKRAKSEQSMQGVFRPGNGYMEPSSYPTWYVSSTGRNVLVDHPEVPPSTWGSFSDFAIQTFKFPFPATVFPPLMAVTNTPSLHFTDDDPVLVVNNSWMTASLMRGRFGASSSVSTFNNPWPAIPSGAFLNDMTSMLSVGDSGSILLYNHPDGTVCLGAIFSASWSYGLQISQSGVFQDCTPPPFDQEGACNFDDRACTTTGGTGSSIFTHAQMLAINVILNDTTWQVTPASMQSSVPEKNISPSDIVDTSPRWLILDAPASSSSSSSSSSYSSSSSSSSSSSAQATPPCIPPGILDGCPPMRDVTYDITTESPSTIHSEFGILSEVSVFGGGHGDSFPVDFATAGAVIVGEALPTLGQIRLRSSSSIGKGDVVSCLVNAKILRDLGDVSHRSLEDTLEGANSGLPERMGEALRMNVLLNAASMRNETGIDPSAPTERSAIYGSESLSWMDEKISTVGHKPISWGYAANRNPSVILSMAGSPDGTFIAFATDVGVIFADTTSGVVIGAPAGWSDIGGVFKISVQESSMIFFGRESILEYDTVSRQALLVPLDGVGGSVDDAGLRGQTYVVSSGNIIYSKPGASMSFIRRGGLDFDSDGVNDAVTLISDTNPSLVVFGLNFAISSDGYRFSRGAGTLPFSPTVAKRMNGFMVFGGSTGVFYDSRIPVFGAPSPTQLSIPTMADGTDITYESCNSIVVISSVGSDGQVRDEYMVCGFSTGHVVTVQPVTESGSGLGGSQSVTLQASAISYSGISCVHHVGYIGGRVVMAGFNEWKFMDENRINRLVSGIPLS